MTSATFTGISPEWYGHFSAPHAVFTAWRHDAVAEVVSHAEGAARAGCWAVLLLAYEAAPAMEPALPAHTACGMPLAVAAIFTQREPVAPLPAQHLPQLSWTPLVTRDAYCSAAQRILAYIAAGDTYQVNYTFPMLCRAPDDLAAWYAALCAAQAAPFCCYITFDTWSVLSLSPELFFARRGVHITTRPMKGTLPRGRWLEEDRTLQHTLAHCPKNRAENLMIVDMLRNDLGRVAAFGSVKVPALFAVEPYHTVLQMTSTITARLRPATTLWDILRALFPCASITGAPKIRTMHIIRELEPHPRGIYTGTIGLLQPGGDCVFNVAIRTIVCDLRTGMARFAVGGGIVADSTPASEYEECQVKAAFLHTPRPQFDLLESLLLRDGAYWLREYHLRRLRSSAAFFGFPLDESAVLAALNQTSCTLPSGRFKVRLLVASTGAVSIEAAPLPPAERAWVLGIAPLPVSSRNVFLFHKTTHRTVYDDAVRACPGCDDVVLWNEHGDVTESTRANIVIERQGRRVTPPRDAGLLAGTFRAALLAHREIVEEPVSMNDLARATRVWLVNSVRGWIDVDVPRLHTALYLHQQARNTRGAV